MSPPDRIRETLPAHRDSEPRSRQMRMRSRLFQLSLLACWLACFPNFGMAAETADAYAEQVEPYVRKYCLECHHDEDAKGDLDLTRYARANDVIGSFRTWNHIVEFIRNGEMPPKDSPQPTIDESNAVVAAVRGILVTEAKKQAGDPGFVPPRRLSNTEYDLSVRELTGIDIRPTRDFPPDPAGGEGFDNTGEALGMSPNLLKKYLSAAQFVADHLVLRTSGIAFAPFPVTSYNERKKLTEQAIIDFYQRHSVELKDYLEAAWRFRYRAADQQGESLSNWAQARNLSPTYLSLVASTLNAPALRTGLLGDLGQAWETLPAPRDDVALPESLQRLCDRIEHYRRTLGAVEPPLIKANAGNWPIEHLRFRADVAAARDRFVPANLHSEVTLRLPRVTQPPANDASPRPLSLFLTVEPAFADNSDEHENYVVIENALFSRADDLPRNEQEATQHETQSLRGFLEQANPRLAESLAFGKHPRGEAIDADAFVIQAPATIEIPLASELRGQLDGKRLLLRCRLDPLHSREGSVYLQPGTAAVERGERSERTELLIHPDSRLVRSLETTAADFCNAFPNRFFYVDSGRGLAAGFHLVEGFFRDDAPLIQKVLGESEREELDRLWRELDFVTQSAETLLRGFVWFERAEREVLHDKRFDFLRAEDPALVEEAMLERFEKLYLDKLGVKRIGDTLDAEVPDARSAMIHGFFQQIRTGLQTYQSQIPIAEQLALRQIDELAERAYRRPLRADERESLRGLQAKLRAEGLDVEASLRGVFTAILMSPDFSYRYQSAAAGEGTYPLSDHELASRLSYFLWSSLPDPELLAAAAEGRLRDEADLKKQTRRMLRDDRVAAFAREFFGQWLRYRDYLSKDPINAQAFADYDDALRQAMFDEPTRLATYLIQQDLPITQLLTSDRTFVNGRLAKHYGGAIRRQYLDLAGDREQDWHPVTGLLESGRGGLFGMAVILTKNSAGERTSPVKRGFWSVHHLLGQHFPPPPAEVAELPTSEKEAERTIRQLLADHVAQPQCAMCHKHFDGLGLTMEGFDAIGRSRSVDSAGRPVDDVARLANGETAAGIPGLIRYIDQHRRQDFVQNLCRKFLGYALGRSVSLSDQPLLDEMEQRLEQNEYRFSVLFDAVIRSPQFRNQRGSEHSTASR